MFKHWLDGSDYLDTDDYCNLAIGTVMFAVAALILAIAYRVFFV